MTSEALLKKSLAQRTNLDSINQNENLSAESLSAGMIGNVLEWYDFGLYGFLAPLIGAHFFPSSNPIASLLGAYGGFAIGFAMRPIGGAVLGHIGDRVGRKAVLIASVVMMGAATTMIGLLPTYQQIGIWAPILLLLVRLFQGFSVGGEFTGSVSFLVETAPRHLRGIAGSVANIGSTLGYLVAAGLAAATVMFSTHFQAHTWIWRVPFIVGGALAVFAYFVRTKLTQTGYEPCEQQDGESNLPLQKAFKEAPRAMILVTIFTWGYGVVNYLTMVFFATFASKFGSINNGYALTVNTFALALAIVVVPISGWLGDSFIRRRSILIIAFGLTLISAIFFFQMAQGASLAEFAVAQLGFAASYGLMMGSAPAMLAERFPSHIRLSGYSVAFNIGIGLGGGTAPLIATALIGATGSNLAPAWYLMICALLSIVALYLMRDRSREPLR